MGPLLSDSVAGDAVRDETPASVVVSAHEGSARSMARVLALTALAVGLLVGPATSAWAQEDDGLLLEVVSTYEMRPDDALIDVQLDITATNTLTDATDEFGVTRFYFDDVVFAIPMEAVDVVASDGSGELAVDVVERPRDGISEASIALRSRLYSGQSRDLRLSFVLPGAAPRSEGDIRIDTAYAWFFLWAYGDPGSSAVTAVIPPEFDVDVVGDQLRETRDDSGRRVFESGEISDPFAWVSVISARNDAELVTSEFEVPGGRIELRSWPSDELWATGVERILSAGIPVLASLIDEPWETDVVITESIEPSIHGYGGWYVSDSDSMEIGEDLDAHLVLHEISHAWFDEGLFAERWIGEGLADVYAAAAVDKIDEVGWEPDPITRSARGNLPLNDWEDPTFDDRTNDLTEDYGYAASWTVIDQVVRDVGFEAMADVFDAAWSDTNAYPGDASFDYVAPRDDWRRFLDLLEQVGGSSQALSLFDTWVANEADRNQLERRYDVRARYESLADRAGTWALPPDLRRAMGAWDFDTASTEIADSEIVIDARDRLDVAAKEAALTVPSLESRFEAGEDADLLAAEIEAQLVVAEVISDATDMTSRDRSWLQAVGLVGVDPLGEIASARASFAQGALEDARLSAERASAWLDVAEQAGRTRVIVAAIVLLLVLTVLVLSVRRRRRRRSPARLEQPDRAVRTI